MLPDFMEKNEFLFFASFIESNAEARQIWWDYYKGDAQFVFCLCCIWDIFPQTLLRLSVTQARPMVQWTTAQPAELHSSEICVKTCTSNIKFWCFLVDVGFSRRYDMEGARKFERHRTEALAEDRVYSSKSHASKAPHLDFEHNVVIRACWIYSSIRLAFLWRRFYRRSISPFSAPHPSVPQRFRNVLHRVLNVSQKSTKNPNFVFTFEGWKMYTKLGFLVTNFSNCENLRNVEEPCENLRNIANQSGKCFHRLDCFSQGFSRFYIDLAMFHKSQPKILTLCSRLKAGKCTQS